MPMPNVARLEAARLQRESAARRVRRTRRFLVVTSALLLTLTVAVPVSAIPVVARILPDALSVEEGQGATASESEIEGVVSHRDSGPAREACLAPLYLRAWSTPPVRAKLRWRVRGHITAVSEVRCRDLVVLSTKSS